MTDRASILIETLKVKSAAVHWHFIADYYDGPISGLAYYQKRLFRFCCFPEDIPNQHVYVLQDLTPDELVEELRIKDKFERLVGTHWSFDFDGKPLPSISRDKLLAGQFYDEESIVRERQPSDRQIVAWFDCAGTPL